MVSRLCHLQLQSLVAHLQTCLGEEAEARGRLLTSSEAANRARAEWETERASLRRQQEAAQRAANASERKASAAATRSEQLEHTLTELRSTLDAAFRTVEETSAALANERQQTTSLQSELAAVAAERERLNAALEQATS